MIFVIAAQNTNEYLNMIALARNLAPRARILSANTPTEATRILLQNTVQALLHPAPWRLHIPAWARRFPATRFLGVPAAPSDSPTPSPLQTRILALAQDGFSTARIARTLALPPATIRLHLASFYARTGTTGRARTAAVCLARDPL